MDDLISRHDALYALCDNCDNVKSVCPHYPCKQYAAINALLPTQPEQKKGKWIVVKRHEHYPSGKPYEQLQCPFCKRFDHNGDGNFCGYCGADMRDEDDNIPIEYYENGGI